MPDIFCPLDPESRTHIHTHIAVEIRRGYDPDLAKKKKRRAGVRARSSKRTRARPRQHRKAKQSKRIARKSARRIKRAAPPAKRSHRKAPPKKLSRVQKLEEKIKRLEKRERDLIAEKRMTGHALEELTRTQRVQFTPERGEGEDEDDDTTAPLVRVEGDIPVRIGGEIVGYELPPMLKTADFDFDTDYDFDDFLDDVGDEENDDAYTEDAG